MPRFPQLVRAAMVRWIERSRHDARDTGFDQRLRARRRASDVPARLERNVDGRAARV